MNTPTNMTSLFAYAMRIRWPMLTLVWGASVAIGFGFLFNYQTAAGQCGANPVTLPEPCQIERNPEQPTLIMFAHPRCPCTHSSVGELAKVLAQLQKNVCVCVVFYVPEGIHPEWAATDLVAKAKAIPGVHVLYDEGGLETRRFGVNTSGHVLLYDTADRLSFTGGITMARGHCGDNVGSQRLLDRITQSTSNVVSGHVVFGCPILDELNLNLESRDE